MALGYFPVVIGKRGHVEVEGLTGDFPERVRDRKRGRHSPRCRAHARYGVISQTTQPIEQSAARSSRPSAARGRRAKCASADTVCQPTKNRQNALRKLLAECDTMVVVGGRNSNNTLQLVAAATVAGLRVFHIERPEELDPAWFRDAEIVGLTAGTSTLKETVAAVHARLSRSIAATNSNPTHPKP